MMLDGAGHALVSHSLSWYADDTDRRRPGRRASPSSTSSGADFPKLSEVAVDSWASLRDAKLGRALFTVPGGILVVNVQNADRALPAGLLRAAGLAARASSWPTTTSSCRRAPTACTASTSTRTT